LNCFAASGVVVRVGTSETAVKKKINLSPREKRGSRLKTHLKWSNINDEIATIESEAVLNTPQAPKPAIK
jgi:hypothetical protein